MSNLKIWDSEKHTPKDQTNKVNRRGGFTAVNHQYQLLRGTMLWGPYGEAWGMDIISMQMVGEAPQTSLLLHCRFYYPSPKDGERCEFEVLNDWPFKMGDDSAKKALTNTRSKALSMLGFSADVYHGHHDNSEYLRDEPMRNDPSLVLKRADQIAKTGSADEIKRARDWAKKALSNGTIDTSVAEILESACITRQAALSS